MKISISDKLVDIINKLNIVPMLYYIPNESEYRGGFISLSPKKNSIKNHVATVTDINDDGMSNVGYNFTLYNISFYTFDDPKTLKKANMVNYATRYLEIIDILRRIFNTSLEHIFYVKSSEISAFEKTIDDMMAYDAEELKLYLKMR